VMEKSGAAPKAGGGGSSPVKVQKQSALLILSALDMSWRLAIAVLVPIIGGYELDKHLGTAPVFMIVGFLLAMAGLFLVLKRTVAAANEKVNARSGR
jgi:F0F1-type ATP synthase assembly protein I